MQMCFSYLGLHQAAKRLPADPAEILNKLWYTQCTIACDIDSDTLCHAVTRRDNWGLIYIGTIVIGS